MSNMHRSNHGGVTLIGRIQGLRPSSCDSIDAMRLATIRTPDGTHAAVVDGDALLELDVPRRRRAPRPARRRRTRDRHRPRPSPTVDLAPVVTLPGKIICQGLNYRSHILEMGHELPTHPTLFAKFREALIGAHDDIVLPARSHQVDWEAELALVIGRRVRHASPAPRRPTRSPGSPSPTTSRCATGNTAPWSGCRARPGSTPTPVGPWLVTPDEVGGPEPDLEIRCEVDGVVRQASRTSELVFSSADLVAYASEFVTLEPGDLLLTGTPAGVGHGMQTPHVPGAGPDGAHGHRAHRGARATAAAPRPLTSRPLPSWR